MPTLATGRGEGSGFTLLELLLVLVILGMASALVIPRFDNTGKKFQAQVREIVAVLKYAKRLAVIEGRPIVARFYRDTAQSGATGSSEEKEYQSATTWTSKGARLSWGKMVDDRLQEELRITFFPEGGNTGADLLLRQDRYAAAIKVDPITGQISVQDGPS